MAGSRTLNTIYNDPKYCIRCWKYSSVPEDLVERGKSLVVPSYFSSLLYKAGVHPGWYF
jgi:hypothetical protein